jgi:hypothetical protein
MRLPGAILLTVFLLQSARAQELEWMRPVPYGSPHHFVLGPGGDIYTTFTGPSPYQGAGNVYTNVHRFAGFLWRFNNEVQSQWTAQIDSQRDIAADKDVLQLTTGADGSILVAGSYEDTLYWNHPSATTSNFQATAAGTQPGWTPADVFLLRVSTNGNLLDAKSLGGHDYQFMSALAASSNGDTVLAGAFRRWAEFGSTVLAEPGGGHWITSVDSNGVPRWAKSLAFTNYIEGPVMTIDHAGNIIVAGAFLGELSVENSRLSAQRDLYLAKFSPSGDLLWLKQGQGDADEAVTAIASDQAGNIYLSARMALWHTGPAEEVRFAPEVKITGNHFIVKFDANGNGLWAIPEELSDISVGPNGNLYGTGLIQGSRSIGPFNFTSVGQWDTLVAQFSPEGDVLWARAVPDSHAPGSLAIGQDGGVYVLFGGGTYPGPGAYIARYSAQGPEIVRQPKDTTVSQGQSAELTVEVQTGAEVNFQWLRNGVALADSERVSGTTSPTLRIASATRDDEGDYTVRIQDSTGTILSSAARLHVFAPVQFTSIEQIETDLVRLTFQGANNLSYRFEATDNLTNWNFVTNSGPNNFSRPGEIIVFDRVQPDQKERFYRAVSL